MVFCILHYSFVVQKGFASSMTIFISRGCTAFLIIKVNCFLLLILLISIILLISFHVSIGNGDFHFYPTTVIFPAYVFKGICKGRGRGAFIGKWYSPRNRSLFLKEVTSAIMRLVSGYSPNTFKVIYLTCYRVYLLAATSLSSVFTPCEYPASNPKTRCAYPPNRLLTPSKHSAGALPPWVSSSWGYLSITLIPSK